MRALLLLPGLLLAVSCDSMGRLAAKFIPAMERLNEEWAPPQMDCESNIPTQKPMRCVAGRIACNDVVEGYSGAGERHYTDKFYGGAKCVPRKHRYDVAPEMIYRLKLQPNTEAIVELVSDCADLDVFGFRWEEKGTCPKDRHYERIPECEMDDSPRGGRIKLNAVNKPVTYLVGVDGKKGAVGNYRLSVTCRQSR